MILTVPAFDPKHPWPTLGDQVCAFIEAYLVFGPGDLRGLPAIIDDEKRALIYRMYEVYPAHHPAAGRRRFKRCAISMRKGTAKTELAAWLAAVELHPAGPVRCDGFDAAGRPVGVGVNDPYIPMVANTAEQSDELAFGALRVILENSEVAGDFDIGLSRIMRIDGAGKAVSLAAAPSARDGARTTFQLFDETHRLTLPNLKAAHRTMMENIPKRFLADAWSLETTTAFAPGENSVAEDTMDYARQVAGGAIKDARLFFFHRQASEDHKLDTPEDIKAAVMEASGPAAAWSDIDSICDRWNDPTSDKAYLARVWCNMLIRGSDRAFDVERWRQLERDGHTIPAGAMIALGFDGGRWHDATGLVATEIDTGFQQPIKVWERPANVDVWEVPADDVDAAVAMCFGTWDVWRLYADPPYWEGLVADWSGKYGEDRVFEWWTNRNKAMAYSIKAFNTAIMAGELSHNGDDAYRRHIGNAVRKYLYIRDDEGQPLWTIYKERPDSPHKIDLAMAGVLSWEARMDAVAAGVKKSESVYNTRGIRTL